MSRRYGAVALALAALLFILYPAARPWHDESTLDGARASMSSGAWVFSHACAMVGFILVPIGLLALRDLLASSLATAALLCAWVGAGLVLPYYGAEDFALHAIASRHPDQLLDLVDAIRFGGTQVTFFGVGLVLLAVCGVLTALAVWRSTVMPRASGILFGVGYALYLPQFFGPAAVRITHGVLLGAGLVWLAAALWTAEPRPTKPRPA